MRNRRFLMGWVKALLVMLVASVAWLAVGIAFGNEGQGQQEQPGALPVSDIAAPPERIAIESEPLPEEQQEQPVESDLTDDAVWDEPTYVQEENDWSYSVTSDDTAYETYETYDESYDAYEYEASPAGAGSGRIDAAYYGDGTDGPYETDGPSHTMPGYYNGRKETYYSSNVLPHYRMDEWTVDDEGFWRDSEGRYVVGVGIDEGYEIGDEIETGKGTAVVMDYGYTINYTDFYTNW